jgi:predicted DCC family thiol-disulfide oxidoreductase YuxK
MSHINHMSREMPSRLILFDGVCNLCSGAVKFVIKYDPNGQFKFASLQSSVSHDILRQKGYPVGELDTFVYIRDGQVYLRSSAALRLLRDMGGLWQVFYVWMMVPRPIRDWVYDRVARSRYSIWGRADSCMVPTPELQDRFIK